MLKMYNIKKTIFILLCFLSFNICVKAKELYNYNNIYISNNEYINLQNLGFNDNEIYYMNAETFNANKDLNAKLLAKEIRYYKTIENNPLLFNSNTIEISKSEFDNSDKIEPRGTVTTEYKSVVTTISSVNDKFRYKVSVTWKKMPSVRSYDVIGIGFKDPVYINSSIIFSFNYCTSTGDCTTSTQYVAKKNTSTGGTAVYQLPQNAVSLTSALYYDVSKNTSNTINSLNMCGDYSHATSKISSANVQKHTIDYNGIQLDSSIFNSYDIIPCAYAGWAGNW